MMMSGCSSIAFWAVLLLATVSEAIDKECFKRYGNCDIVLYNAYRKDWRIDSEQKCVDICQKEAKCQSVVYDVQQRICNLYDQDGTVRPAFIIPAFKKVYYKLGACGGVSVTAGPPGPVHGTTPRTTVEIPSSAANCPQGAVPFVIDFEKAAIKPSGGTAEIRDTTLFDCHDFCRENLDFDGNSQTCWGATFYPEGGQGIAGRCEIYSERVSPYSQNDITRHASANAIVKICDTENAVTGACDPAFLGSLAESVIGHEIETLSDLRSGYDGLAECVTRCLQSEVEQQTICRSASFYPDSRDCELRMQSRITAPDDVIESTDDERRHWSFTNGCHFERKRTNAAVIKNNTKERASKQIPFIRRPAPPAPASRWRKIGPPALQPNDGLNRLLASKYRYELFYGPWTHCRNAGNGVLVKVRVRVCQPTQLGCPDELVQIVPCTMEDE